MTLTDEQQLILDHPLPPSSILKARAYAGAGKTSTLVEVAHKVPESLYLAFNKSVADEAVEKFPATTTCQTAHAMAYKVVGSKFGKIRNLYSWQLTKPYGLSVYEASMIANTLDKWCKSASPIITPDDCHPDVLNRFPGYPERLIDLTTDIWDDLCAGRNGLSMTHSGYMKLFQLGAYELNFPVIFLDEAQDINPVLFDIVQIQRQACHSAVLAVGDPYQQIYSWNGAVDAMQQMPGDELRITQSFRFGPAIADLASRLLSTAFDEPIPLRGLPSISSTIGNVSSSNHTIICRTNTGVVSAAYSAAKLGHSIHVIGEGAFTDTLASLEQIYFLYSGQRTSLTEKRLTFYRSYKQFHEYVTESLDIEGEIKCRIIEQYKSEWPYVESAIRAKLVPMDKADIVLTTCHKAKGLEWDNVRLHTDFKPLFFYHESTEPDESDWQFKDLIKRPTDPESELNPEEVNLIYVALTRAKKTLQIDGTDLNRLFNFKPSA